MLSTTKKKQTLYMAQHAMNDQRELLELVSLQQELMQTMLFLRNLQSLKYQVYRLIIQFISKSHLKVMAVLLMLKRIYILKLIISLVKVNISKKIFIIKLKIVNQMIQIIMNYYMLMLKIKLMKIIFLNNNRILVILKQKKILSQQK